jgi:hypothetical protein
MASNRLLNWKSNHSIKQKLNVANNLIKRICELMTANKPKDNITIIRKILAQNNYPTKLINKLFQNYIKTQSEKKIEVKHVDKSNIKYRTFPNVSNLTNQVTKCVRRFDNNIQICPKNIKKVKGLHSVVKDKIEIEKQTDLIYGIPCKELPECEEWYYGMTQQRFGKRKEQHLGDIIYLHKLRMDLGIEKTFDIKEDIDKLRAEIIEKIEEEKKGGRENGRKTKEYSEKLTKIKKLETQCEKSGLVAHHIKLGHRIDFQNAKIIDREQNRKKLEILEVLHIKTNEQNMNKKEDLNKIKNHYDGVLSKIRKHNNRKKEIKKNLITLRTQKTSQITPH